PHHIAQDTGPAARPVAAPMPRQVATFRWTPLAVPRHPALLPGGRLGVHAGPAAIAAAWERSLRASLPSLKLAAAGPAATPTPAAPAESLATPAFAAHRPMRFLGTTADLGMELNVRFELKADRFQNLKCTPIEQQQAISGCRVGFPTISPVPQYAIRTAGVVGQRLHVNVDFDSQREFDANNNLRVWYEGLEDDVLKRVE